MRPVELARDVPAHVPEHAAEVEDDAAQSSLLPEGLGLTTFGHLAGSSALAYQELVATTICSAWEAAHTLQHVHQSSRARR